MDYQKLTFEQRDNMGIVTMANPPVNTLDEGIIADMEHLFGDEGQKAWAGLRALIITGAGEKFFMAGADISAFPALNGANVLPFVKRRTDLFDRIAALPLPVIGAVNGFALGAGLELALACDIRVFAKNAKAGLPETGLGIFPGAGGTQRLPRLIGPGMAKRMIFSGAPITAEEAYRVGLCEMLAETGTVLECALELAQKIAENGPVAVAKAKQVIDQGLDLDIREAMALENAFFGRVCDTQDKNEGAAAFMEKRKPVFTGQ
jgi:enoyl-CoA hydratase/carnithine racemase